MGLMVQREMGLSSERLETSPGPQDGSSLIEGERGSKEAHTSTLWPRLRDFSNLLWGAIRICIRDGKEPSYPAKCVVPWGFRLLWSARWTSWASRCEIGLNQKEWLLGFSPSLMPT